MNKLRFPFVSLVCFVVATALQAQTSIPWEDIDTTGSSLADIDTREFSALQNKPTTLSGYGITDAATSAQGAKADTALQSAAIGVTIQAYDADLADLADGSLSGSKVGTGINADNITTGTVADARIASTIARDSEVTTAISDERSATATLTNKTISAANNTLQPSGLFLNDTAGEFGPAGMLNVLRPGVVSSGAALGLPFVEMFDAPNGDFVGAGIAYGDTQFYFMTPNGGAAIFGVSEYNVILDFVTNPTAGRSYQFPDSSGTVVLLVSPPSTASSTGTAGQIAYDSGYIYVCVATNTWKRAALSTW